MTETVAALDELEEAIKQEIHKESAPLEIETEVTQELAQEFDASLEVSEAVTEVTETVETENDKVQKRFDRLTYEKYEAIRRAEALEKQLQETQSKQPSQELTQGAPKIEDFNDEDYGYDDSKKYAAYAEALTDYKLSTFSEVQANAQRESQAKNKQVELSNKYLGEVEKYAQEHPSYYQDVIKLPEMAQDKLDMLKTSGAKIVHYVARHPEIAQEIANSDLGSAAFKLGTLSAQLSTNKHKPQLSKAPEPVDTIQGSGSLKKSYEDMSIEELMSVNIGKR